VEPKSEKPEKRLLPMINAFIPRKPQTWIEALKR
jgi:hypothetical protein